MRIFEVSLDRFIINIHAPQRCLKHVPSLLAANAATSQTTTRTQPCSHTNTQPHKQPRNTLTDKHCLENYTTPVTLHPLYTPKIPK